MWEVMRQASSPSGIGINTVYSVSLHSQSTYDMGGIRHNLNHNGTSLRLGVRDALSMLREIHFD